MGCPNNWHFTREFAFYILKWYLHSLDISLAILNAGSLFFGRILPNIMATLFGPMNLLIGACTVSSMCLYVWFTATENAGILAFAVIFGMASGTTFAVPSRVSCS